MAHRVVVGDGDEVQPAFHRVSGQFSHAHDPVGVEGMRVQVPGQPGEPGIGRQRTPRGPRAGHRRRVRYRQPRGQLAAEGARSPPTRAPRSRRTAPPPRAPRAARSPPATAPPSPGRPGTRASRRARRPRTSPAHPRTTRGTRQGRSTPGQAPSRSHAGKTASPAAPPSRPGPQRAGNATARRSGHRSKTFPCT